MFYRPLELYYGDILYIKIMVLFHSYCSGIICFGLTQTLNQCLGCVHTKDDIYMIYRTFCALKMQQSLKIK